MSHFNSCQLIWTCHNRTTKNKISRLRERCYKTTKKTSFHDLVEKDSFVSIYHRNLRSDFTLTIVRSVNYGIESIRYLGPKIWENIIANIKEVHKIERFKSGIKKWKPESCRLSKTYMQATPCFTCFS